MQLKVQDFHRAPDVVFLHGWGVNCGVFKGLLPHLEAHMNIRFLDLPGFGVNAQVDVSNMSFEDYCNVVGANLPDDCVLVGWSLGGLIAQHIANTGMCKLRKLVTICSSPAFVQSDDWKGIKPEVLAQFESQLAVDFSKTLERFLAIQSMGSETARSDLKTLKSQVFELGMPCPLALKKGLRFLSDIDLRQQLIHSSVETLRIFGRNDSLVPVKSADKIQALDPDATHVVVEKASHAPFISHVEGFVPIFRQFVEK